MVEEGPGIFRGRVLGGDQEEVDFRAMGGGLWSWFRGGGRVDTGEQGGMEGG